MALSGKDIVKLTGIMKCGGQQNGQIRFGSRAILAHSRTVRHIRKRRRTDFRQDHRRESISPPD